jgi:hypothetical protein
VRRWLKNSNVIVGELWRAIAPALLASRAGQELVLVFDPTPLIRLGNKIAVRLEGNGRPIESPR